MIRLGTLADLAAASSVYRRASLSNAGDRGNLLAHPEYLILGPEGLAEGRTHVAERDGSVVGFATWAETAGTMELEDLFVDPDYMRRGIATALVNCIAEVLRARGVERLEVTANPHALGFTALSVSSTAASRKRSSAPRLAWRSRSPDCAGIIGSRAAARVALMARPVGGGSGCSPEAHRCINIRPADSVTVPRTAQRALDLACSPADRRGFGVSPQRWDGHPERDVR